MQTIEKLDLTKSDPNYYRAYQQPTIVDLDPYYYLSFQGQCSPEDPYFMGAIEHLYAVAYAVKFLTKSEDNDFVVPKMEGQWWIAGGAEAQAQFESTPKEEWYWRIMIRMPDFVEAEHFFRALQSVKKKKPELVHIDQVKFELINEGTVAQGLHIGSYDHEKPTVDKLHSFIGSEGMKINGIHHEIYLSDPRKTAPEKLKTIIRYPIQKN